LFHDIIVHDKAKQTGLKMNEDRASVPNFYHRFIIRSGGILIARFSITPKRAPILSDNDQQRHFCLIAFIKAININLF